MTTTEEVIVGKFNVAVFFFKFFIGDEFVGTCEFAIGHIVVLGEEVLFQFEFLFFA